MENINKYKRDWRIKMDEATTLLQKGDSVGFEKKMEEAKNISDKCNEAMSLMYNCKNFGMANYIFEDALPYLFKNDKKSVRKFVNTIKEDKNLSSAFKFQKALSQYDGNSDAKDYVNEAIELVRPMVNKKTMNESTKKLSTIITNNDIYPSQKISEDKMKFFESCNYVLSHTKGLLNLNKYNSNVETICKYITENKSVVKESKENIQSLVENLEAKYGSVLTEEERNLVQDIIDCRRADGENKRRAMFEKFQEECIKSIDKMLDEGVSDEEKYALIDIKEQVLSKRYCEETAVADLAKLLEIRDVLLEK